MEMGWKSPAPVAVSDGRWLSWSKVLTRLFDLCDKPFLLHTSQPAPPAKLAHLDTCIHLNALNESMQRCSSSILIKRGCGCSSRRSVRRVCVV